jgi:hypothetical protein
LRAEIATIFGPNVVAISARNTKISVQNLSTLQGYIFRILQHFATKLCNFTNFSMALSSCGDLFASPCLVLKLVYNGNCLYLCIIFSFTSMVFDHLNGMQNGFNGKYILKSLFFSH